MKQSWKQPLTLEDAEVLSIENYIQQFPEVFSPNAQLNSQFGSQTRFSLSSKSSTPSAAAAAATTPTSTLLFPTAASPFKSLLSSSQFTKSTTSQAIDQQQTIRSNALLQRHTDDDKVERSILKQSNYDNLANQNNTNTSSKTIEVGQNRSSIIQSSLSNSSTSSHDKSLEQSLKQLLNVVNDNITWKQKHKSEFGFESLRGIQQAVTNYEKKMDGLSKKDQQANSKNQSSDLTKDEFKMMQLETENYLLREQVSEVKSEKQALTHRITTLEARTRSLADSLQGFNEKFLEKTTDSTLRKQQAGEIVKSVESVVAMQQLWEEQSKDMDSLSLSLLRAYTPVELQAKLEDRVQKIDVAKQNIKEQMHSQLRQLIDMVGTIRNEVEETNNE